MISTTSIAPMLLLVAGPDMFIAPNDILGDDARAGLIADITDLADGKLDGVNQLGIDGMTVEGKSLRHSRIPEGCCFLVQQGTAPHSPCHHR